MTMEKKIKSELTKMGGIMAVLVLLGIYAHEFVIAGLQAKLVLNLSIFILAGVAAWVAFRHVFSLKNETIALKALQVDYGNRRRRPVNPYRHPAVVFNEPELLGHGYRMITEELSKQGEVKISNSTVQMLLHDVDARINDRKSTIMYFSGLMVFLGLLGAFMGLMKTVHSVSDLIGAMDLSATAGVDGMAKMIDGMKAPLNGMSVGFSSSLFGLLTSMVLGALERCMTSAMKALRNEFEHWLSNVADLESNNAGRQTGEVHVTVDGDFAEMRALLAASNEQLERLCSAAIHAADDEARTRAALAGVAGSVVSLTETVERLHDPKPLLQPIADVVTELAANQTAILMQFKALNEQAKEDRGHVTALLTGMTAAVERMNTLDGNRLHDQFERLATLMAKDRLDRRQSQRPAVRGRGYWASLLEALSGRKALVRYRRSRTANLPGKDGNGADPLAAGAEAANGPDAGLNGPRRAIDMLRRRLNAETSDDDSEMRPKDAPPARRTTGRGE